MRRVSLRWYVAQTEPFKGLLAEAEVMALGYLTFHPKVRTVRRWRKSKPRERIQPYVPGYLFVSFDADEEGWQRINKQRGVKALMYSSLETPARVRDDALLPLMAMCDADGYLNEQEADCFLFKVGNTVRATDGPFAGMVGKVVQRSSHDRVKVMLSIFGRPTPVESHPGVFELVAA